MTSSLIRVGKEIYLPLSYCASLDADKKIKLAILALASYLVTLPSVIQTEDKVNQIVNGIAVTAILFTIIWGYLSYRKEYWKSLSN